MGVNVRLDRAFSILLSTFVLAVTCAVGAAVGFLVGVVGVPVCSWVFGLSGTEWIVLVTVFGVLVGLWRGVKYCKAVYWSDVKLR